MVASFDGMVRGRILYEPRSSTEVGKVGRECELATESKSEVVEIGWIVALSGSLLEVFTEMVRAGPRQVAERLAKPGFLERDSSAPYGGLLGIPIGSHGLRCGLYSFAASRLGLGLPRYPHW